MKAYFVLLLAALATASPVAELVTKAKVTPNTQGNVFVCQNDNFGAPCGTFHGSSGQCVNFPSDFNDNISSFGPDADQDCFIFKDANCQGQTAGPIRSPGIAALSSIGLNDAISSFQCFFG